MWESVQTNADLRNKPGFPLMSDPTKSCSGKRKFSLERLHKHHKHDVTAYESLVASTFTSLPCVSVLT